MEGLGSRFLSASAGSGKTYALSTRFCRLVMAGAPPEAICALTFTRAATREIFAAVVARLLEGVAPPPGGLDAREALRRVLEALPRLQISTIDAFSARVAKLFAYELGLDPDFSLYEEGSGPEAREMLRETVRRALRVTPRDSAEALLGRFDVRYEGAASAKPLTERLGDYVRDFGAVLRAHPDGWGDLARVGEAPPLCDDRRACAEALGAQPTAQVSDRHAAAYHDLIARLDPSVESVRELKARWGDKTADTLGRLRRLAVEGCHVYYNKVLTVDEAGRRAARALFDDLLARDLAQTAAHTRRLRAAVAALNAAASALADETGRLTFGALTELLARRLGGRLSVVDPDALYVAYRLDCAVRHLMIDEFQDTSVSQWAVLSSLARELAEGGDSTFFYVGDVKQSIYGWRGGDATLFGDVSRVPDVPAGPPLLTSYRSSPAVVGLVNDVLRLDASDVAAAEPWQQPALEAWRRGWQDHVAHRDDAGLALCVAVEGAKKEDWLGVAADFIAARWRELRGKRLRLAVLAFQNADLDTLLALLRARGVACAIDGRMAVHDTPMGQLACRLTHWLADPRATLWGEVARRLGLTDTDDAATLARWTRQIAEGGFAPWLDGLFAGATRARLSGQDREALAAMRVALEALDARGHADPTEAKAALEALAIPCAADSATLNLMTVHHSKGLTYDVVFTLLNGAFGKAPAVCETGPDWVLEPPAFPDSAQALPAFAAAERKRRAQRFRDDLCGLYVSITRARREQVILAPAKECFAKGRPCPAPDARAWLPFRKLAAPDAPDWGLPGIRVACLRGDREWWRAEPERAAEPDERPPRTPWRRAAGVAREETELPSERARAATVAELLAADADAALRFGLSEHARLAAIDWEEAPAVFPEVFRRPAEPCELWRERPFAVSLREGGRTRRLAGQFDRVHLFPKSRRAVIYDFKTSRVPAVTPAYARQLRDYRAALAALTGFAPAAIRMVLLFTRSGRAVEVPGA